MTCNMLLAGYLWLTGVQCTSPDLGFFFGYQHASILITVLDLGLLLTRQAQLTMKNLVVESVLCPTSLT